MPVLTDSNKSERVLKKFSKMKSSRVNWENHWEDLARYFLPDKDNVFKSRIDGEKKFNKIFTGMPVHANERLASALHGMLTNPSTTWFGLSTGVKELDEDESVKGWLQHVVDRMIQTLNQSNFQTQIHEVYLDLGCFGTSLLLVEEDDETTVNFLSRPIYMAYVEENHKGAIDTLAFERKRKLRQIAQEFGHEVLSEDLKSQLLNAEQQDKEYTIVHMVEPREDFNPKKKNVQNKPFSSTHVILETGDVVKESGFNEMPYIVSRWSKISGEVYGRSPAMKALPDAKMLNAMKKATIQGAQKIVDPPLVAPDDGVLLPIRTAPGSINYKRAGTKDTIEPLITGARPDLGEQLMQSVAEDINKAFFLDQMNIREGDRMTATETIQRRDENLRSLSPLLGRQEHELLRKLIDRVFNIMMRSDRFDPAPEILADVDLEVKYTSQIAKAQRTADSDDLGRVLQLIGGLAEAKPETLDLFNQDGIVKGLANDFGLPVEFINSDEVVKQTRAGRAQAQQKQAELEDTNAEVDIAQKASTIGG